MSEPGTPPFDATWTPDGVNTFSYRVAAFVFAQNRILLAKAAKDNYWHLPGGRVQLGESATVAIRRELLEELGRKPTDVELKLITENFFSIPDASRHTQKVSELALYFQCHVSGLELERFHGPEGAGITFSWFSKDDLRKVDLRPIEVREVVFELPDHPVHLEIGQRLAIKNRTQGRGPLQC